MLEAKDLTVEEILHYLSVDIVPRCTGRELLHIIEAEQEWLITKVIANTQQESYNEGLAAGRAEIRDFILEAYGDKIPYDLKFYLEEELP